jgi:hypothetical protein
VNWKPWLIEIDDKHDDFTMNGNSSHQTVKLPEDNPIYIIYISGSSKSNRHNGIFQSISVARVGVSPCPNLICEA